MAISGLHVGLIIGFVYLFVSSFWGVSAYLCQWVASQRVGALIGLIAGTCYALLAGFGLPTQRALIMACCFMLGTIFLKRSYPWHSFALSLLFVVLLNPFSIYMPGFYLSFFVVFIILSFMREQSFQWFRLQLFITVMLFPLSLYCFDYASVVSLPANLVAIPLVSFIFLPLSLILCVLMYSLPYLAKGIVLVLSVVKSFLLSYLSILSNVHFLQIHYPIQSIWQVIVLSLGLWLIFRASRYHRLLGLCCFLPIFIFPFKERLPEGHLKLTLLDVGQGLAVLVKTQDHVLLYDTGIKFLGGSDMGKIVILPYLNYHRISILDKVIISHSDIDHRGGLESIVSQKKVHELIDNDRKKERNCHNILPWTWNKIHFRFLALSKRFSSDNNNSCVLQIDNQYQRVLLTGDIERKAEVQLIKDYGSTLHSTLLLVPHHGSKTSSHEAFIREVSPTFALVARGRFNRYHFPHKKVVLRFKSYTIPLFDTGECGQIDWIMKPSYTVRKPECYIRKDL